MVNFTLLPMYIVPSMSTMNLLSFPFEVFEMILGEITFSDLPYFLQTSKTVNVLTQKSGVLQVVSVPSHKVCFETCGN